MKAEGLKKRRWDALAGAASITQTSSRKDGAWKNDRLQLRPTRIRGDEETRAESRYRRSSPERRTTSWQHDDGNGGMNRQVANIVARPAPTSSAREGHTGVGNSCTEVRAKPGVSPHRGAARKVRIRAQPGIAAPLVVAQTQAVSHGF